jgi:hypothetical protein
MKKSWPNGLRKMEKNSIVDTIGKVFEEPVAYVNAGAIGFTMMNVTDALKIGVLVLTIVWTSVKILNEWKQYKQKKDNN